MKPTTSQYSIKPYKCNRCGAITQEGTNHYGEIYSPCRSCPPFARSATVKTCQIECPPDMDKPTPWNIVRVADLLEIDHLR